MMKLLLSLLIIGVASGVSFTTLYAQPVSFPDPFVDNLPQQNSSIEFSGEVVSVRDNVIRLDEGDNFLRELYIPEGVLINRNGENTTIDTVVEGDFVTIEVDSSSGRVLGVELGSEASQSEAQPSSLLPILLILGIVFLVGLILSLVFLARPSRRIKTIKQTTQVRES